MKKRLLPILLLSALFMVGCVNNGGGKDKGGDDSGETTTYGVAIANKEALQAKWYTDSNQRSLTITLTPEANALAELGAGNLTVTSSAQTIVSVTGLAVNPMAPGKATITVAYHGKTDSVELEVFDGDAKARYGTTHSGTEADPFDNEDALLVAKSPDYEQQTFYVRGEIASFYHAPGSRTDGAVSWFLKPAEENGEKFEIYKCYKKETDTVKGEATYLTDDDVWKGGIATAYGTFTSYNGQYETSSAIFVGCEGEKPKERQTLEKTFAETLAAGKALADGDTSWDYYKFDAYVTKQSGTDYFLTATKGEEITDEKANTIEIYHATTEQQAKLLSGAKVTVTMELKNYHGQVETNGNGNLQALVVVEEGEAWSHEYVKVNVAQALTAAKALGDGKTSNEYYELTGKVKAITEAYSSYGNMSFTVVDADTDTETLTVFRLPVTEEQAATVLVGATVVVKGQLQNYVKDGAHTYELVNGTFVSASGGAAADVVKATVAEAIVEGLKLASDGKTASEKDFEITGYVVKRDFKFNYFIADATDADVSTSAKLKENAVELYNVSDPATRAKLLNGAKVTVKMKICNYNSTIENSGGIKFTFDTATPGAAWADVPTEAKASEVLAAAKALNASAQEQNNKTKSVYSNNQYKMTGKVKAVTSNYASGKMSFTVVDVDAAADAETLLVYNFFTDAETAAKIVADKEIVLIGLACDFDKYTTSAGHTHTYQLCYADFVSVAE